MSGVKQKNKIKLLFSSAGRRVALMEIFMAEALGLGLALETHAIDVDPVWSPACQIADFQHTVPRVDSQEFVPTVLALCREYQISAIVPTSDLELLLYAQNRQQFAELGVRIWVSSEEAIKIFRDKYQSMRLFEQLGVHVPKTQYFHAGDKVDLQYPLVAKPLDGSCSEGLFFIQEEAELSTLDTERYNYILQEQIFGDELTVNVFVDQDQSFYCATPHLRKKVRDGEVCFAQTFDHPFIQEAAEKIAFGIPGLSGVFCFQGMLNEQGFFVFELNPRFGGGYPIADKAGNHMVRWLLQQLIGVQPEYSKQWQEGLRMLRYDAAVFV